MEETDRMLLDRYVRTGCEEAFARIVSRHINMVYSIAMRRTRSQATAEDVVQSVFLLLARKGITFSSRIVIAGWLCRTTRYVCNRALTAERRRLQREGELCMQSQTNESAQDAWAHIMPFLDEAMEQLGDKDQNALVLRFFQDRSFKQIGETLGTSEAAAKMRVARSIAKLGRIFAKRGIGISATVMAAALSAHSVQAAPAALKPSVIAATVKSMAASSCSSPLLGLPKALAWAKLQYVLMAAVILTSVAGISMVAVERQKSATRSADFSFQGYATPEATIQSIIWAASKGNLQKLADGITPEELRTFMTRFPAASESELQSSLISWARDMAKYRVSRKVSVSEDEVHVLLKATPSPNALVDGEVRLRLRRFGDVWKQAGQVPQTQPGVNSQQFLKMKTR